MEAKAKQQTEKARSVHIYSDTTALSFNAGLYRFKVKSASPVHEPNTNVPFPALLVAAAPGYPFGVVEFLGNPAAVSAWLCNVGEMIGVRIAAAGATLVLSSLRVEADKTRKFEIVVEQIDTVNAAEGREPPTRSASLRLQLGLHLREVGDQEYIGADWAGRPGSGSWIEALSITPLEAISASDIEYKGLAANGFETPWLSDGAVCGTKGVGMPLVGFALRLRPSVAALYDCEYSGFFRSGATVGPMRAGVPCRSKTASDPLEAVQIRLLRKSAAGAARAPVAAPAQPAGPSFGKFRDAPAAAPQKAAVTAAPTNASSKPATSKPAPSPAKAPNRPAAKTVTKSAAKPATKSTPKAEPAKKPAVKAVQKKTAGSAAVKIDKPAAKAVTKRK